MKQFQRAIFFTKVPLGGFYQYRDIFQIFPADLENIPKSSFQKHFPNIIEIWISDEEKEKTYFPIELMEFKDILSTSSATIVKQDKILGLLTAFTNNLFFRYTDTTGAWGMPMLKDNLDEEVNTWSSKWCIKWFHFPELPQQFQISQFTEQTIQPIKKIPHKQFYMFYPNLDYDSDTDLVLPDTIDELFDAYYSLDEARTSFIDTSISYTVSAVELMDSKKTLSLLASFTAMETMINLEYKDLTVEQCQSCGQTKYSVARKFREYLIKYVAYSENAKKKFNSYYSLRSKIIHTGRQLRTESLFADVPREEHASEIITRVEILQIGKLATVNWLLMHDVPIENKTIS